MGSKTSSEVEPPQVDEAEVQKRKKELELYIEFIKKYENKKSLEFTDYQNELRALLELPAFEYDFLKQRSPTKIQDGQHSQFFENMENQTPEILKNLKDSWTISLDPLDSKSKPVIVELTETTLKIGDTEYKKISSNV